MHGDAKRGEPPKTEVARPSGFIKLSAGIRHCRDRAENNSAIKRSCARVVPVRSVNAKLRLLFVLTRITKSMNPFAVCGDPRADKGPRIPKMTKDEIIDCFRSAPMGSRHERMLWAAEKIARLTGTTEGESYQKLLIALIEADKELDLREFYECA
jgi:hypothetical protein